MKISDKVYERIRALSEEGNDLSKKGLFVEAKKKYVEALRLVPEPHTNWQAATWLYSAIGDMHFKLNDFEKVMKCYINAVQCPEGLGNPYIHLRLGQAFYELGNFDKAADELTRAYMGSDVGIFLEDDPKYLAFLETKIEI